VNRFSISPLIAAKAELTHNDYQVGPIVLSTRVRLARNLSQFFFPGWANEAQRKKILKQALSALKKVPFLSGGTFLELDNLTELEKQILIERHLISRELASDNKNAGVAISADQSCAIMINEEDHLRIQLLRSGFKLRDLWKIINQVDTAIEENLDFAFSQEWGYLTACPTNLGTGIRASAMMHLPGLVLANHMEKVVRMVSQVGVAVRGLFGEGTDAKGSVFQISNQQTLGESEEEILKRLMGVLDAIIEQEENARLKLMEDSQTKLLDKIGRARGILQNAHMLSSEESMNMLSLMRLAVDLEFFPESYRVIIDRLFIEAQPGHVQYAAGGPISPEDRDLQRATLLREHFKAIPPLTLNN
jgi:protein arginine kinase